MPRGWRGNPSRWRERAPVICLALVGFGIAVYLALYQMGVVADVWEPFFGDGSREVLHSKLSRSLPVPDAALGAFGYLLDVVTGSLGGRRRWRTHPLLVLVFGLLVCAFALVSLGLVFAQAFVVGQWCTLCLCSAALSLVIPFLAASEVRASWRLVRRERGWSLRTLKRSVGKES